MEAMPQTKTLLLELDTDWLTIWLNRPDARNALNKEMVAELTATLDAVRSQPAIRGITMRGKGGIFCAGGDIKEFRAAFQGDTQKLAEGNSAQVAAANRRAGELFARINQLPQVVVMLVEGAAIAGGMGMICAADIVVVTRQARFSLTETTLGIPPAQIAPYVVRRLGLATARRLMLTAARFDGELALQIGLASEWVEDAADLDSAEMAVRAQVRRCAPQANAATKEILLACDQLEPALLRQFAGEKFAECMLSDEGIEGVAAFVEKRKPHWMV